MSETQNIKAPVQISSGFGSERNQTLMTLSIFGLIVVLLIALGLSRPPSLENSAVGFKGLARFAQSEDLPVQLIAKHGRVPRSSTQLYIAALFDTDRENRPNEPQGEEEEFEQIDLMQSWGSALGSTAAEVDTLAVLPKWRAGVYLGKEAHPTYRIPPDLALNALLTALPTDTNGTRATSFVELHQEMTGFVEFTYQAQDGARRIAQIYAPQTLRSASCTPIIGTRDAMILGRCPYMHNQERHHIFVLSDPDLFNNHGLYHGDNALIARDFMQSFVQDTAPIGNDEAAPQTAQILISHGGENFLSLEYAAPTFAPARSWSDLLRFVQYPFIILWVGSGLLLGFAIWRSAMQFGQPVAENMTEMASKRQTIAAQTRLMRRTRSDGTLLRRYIPVRLGAVSKRLFGPAHQRLGTDADLILNHCRKTHPRYTARLEELIALKDTAPDMLTPQTAMAYADEIDDILERLMNDT